MVFKSLYNHWPKYQEFDTSAGKDVPLDSKVEQDFWDFVAERHKIWERRQAGQAKPWTEDPILQKNHIINMYRELDKQTLAWHTMIQPVKDDLDLMVLNFSYMRFCSHIDTVEKTGLLTFNEADQRRAAGIYDSIVGKKMGSAYVFPISGANKTEHKGYRDFIYYQVPKAAVLIAEGLRAQKDGSIALLTDKLGPLFGFNAAFHTAEILMDIGYQRPDLVDERKEFPIGPGAAPTMKALNPNAKPRDVALSLMKHQPIESFPYLIIDGKPAFMTTANLENASCEFRKYTNLKRGGYEDGSKNRTRIYRGT